MRRVYGIFVGSRFNFCTTKRGAIKTAKELGPGAYVRSISRAGWDECPWDVPTFRVSSVPVWGPQPFE